uniref:sialin-like isoform X2 n=1 Tax=Styela clava TaxID=7725 RepID=UPI001939E209|nr:sialin-like isoform X2 [Styela clava]
MRDKNMSENSKTLDHTNEGDYGGNISLYKEITRGCYIKARHVLLMMSCIAKFNLFSLRNNLSIAIVAMVNHTEKTTKINSSDFCPDRGSSEIPKNENGVFDWDIWQETLLLGSYYYVYPFSNIVGGYLAKRFGVKLVSGMSMLFSSILTILIPLIANSGFGMFVAARILLGTLQGPIAPSVHSAIGQWIPPLERSAAVAIVSSGNSMGPLLTFPVAGIIADQLGWEAVFYTTGGVALLCSLLWFAIIHDLPCDHPRISEEEKSYIEKAMESSQEIADEPTPWKSIFVSIPVWAAAIGFFASNWGLVTCILLLPTYMSTILRFDLAASGILSALPYLLQIVTILIAGHFSDVIRRRRIAKTVTVRKVNSFLNLIIPSIFIVLAGYSGCNVVAAVGFFSLSIAFLAFNATSHEANIIDVAPRYSGITCGIVNALGNIPGFLAPQMAGLILANGQTIEQWQHVFWMSAAVATSGFVFFAIFGSGKVQPWAHSYDDNGTKNSRHKANERTELQTTID